MRFFLGWSSHGLMASFHVGLWEFDERFSWFMDCFELELERLCTFFILSY